MMRGGPSLKRKWFWVAFFFLTAGLPLALGLAALAASGSTKALEAGLTLTFILWSLCLGMVVAFVLSILVHELGHLAFGRWAGMQFGTVVVLGAGVAYNGSRYHWFRGSSLLVGGLVMMNPATTDPAEVIRRFRRCILGGPLVSLVYAVALTSLYLYMREVSLKSWETSFVFACMVAAIAILPGTLLPFTSQGFNTDMKQLGILAHPGEQRDRLAAMVLLGQLKVRAREWQDDLVQKALHPSDGSVNECNARLLAYFYALDCGRLDDALVHVERAREVATKLGRHGGTVLESSELELAYLLLLNGEDSGKVREFVEKHPKPGEYAAGARERLLAALASSPEEEAEHIAKAMAALELLHLRYNKAAATERAWLQERAWVGRVPDSRESLTSIEKG